MSKESTRWEKADISYRNYMDFILRKEERYELSLIDLLYVSNFKGGNASINEKESFVNQKLRRYSSQLRAIHEDFGDRRLADLSSAELRILKAHVDEFIELTSKDSVYSIDGFKSSYTSALMHFYFPELIPILDRRVLNGASIKVKTNKQGQVVNIQKYYSPLIDRFYNEQNNRQTLTLRQLDKEFFIKEIKEN